MLEEVYRAYDRTKSLAKCWSNSGSRWQYHCKHNPVATIYRLIRRLERQRITGGVITGNTVNGATVNGGTVNGAVVTAGQ